MRVSVCARIPAYCAHLCSIALSVELGRTRGRGRIGLLTLGLGGSLHGGYLSVELFNSLLKNLDDLLLLLDSLLVSPHLSFFLSHFSDLNW